MENPFKTLLARQDLSAGYPVGSFVMSASPLVAEAMGCAGFDWAVIDMEHAPLDLGDLVHMLQAVAGTAMLPITRLPWNDTVMVKRVLDAGAQTLLFPFVQDADEARRAVAACKYPPVGERGMAAMSRGSRFGTVKDYFKLANDAVSVIVQIESPRAMQALEEIAGVAGVDSIFIGPGDLSGAMGHVGDLLHPQVVELMARSVQRCHALGMPIGTVGGTLEAVTIYRQAGFDYVGVASDLGLMMRTCTATLSTLRAQDVRNHAKGGIEVASVELRQVVKSYDGKSNVIHGIDLEVEHGEFVVFVGPSGCGKSTLLRMIAGLESITGGDVVIDGRRVNDEAPRNRDIAMVFQDYALYPHKNLYDNMAFGLRLRKTPEAEITSRVMDAARLLQIEHMLDRKPAALSGGQRQRVAIGRAIVRQPKVFLFDEPLSNLDAQLRGEMRTEIKKLHQRLGATIIYVTHDQVEAMTLADRIAVLSAGRTMQYAAPSDIYNTPAATFVAGFTGSPPMNLLGCKLADGQLQLGTAAFPLPRALDTQAAGGTQLVFGIRPENIALQSSADAVELPAQVVITEPLGAETLVTFDIGGHELVARCSASFAHAPGTRMAVYMDPTRMHLFDHHSGLSLR